MRFSKKNFLLGAALLFLGTALGFGLGNFFGAAPLIGCPLCPSRLHHLKNGSA